MCATSFFFSHICAVQVLLGTFGLWDGGRSGLFPSLSDRPLDFHILAVYLGTRTGLSSQVKPGREAFPVQCFNIKRICANAGAPTHLVQRSLS